MAAAEVGWTVFTVATAASLVASVNASLAAARAFRPDEIINIDKFASAIARPGFARGLCVLPEGLVAAGSSPSTISVYDMRAGKRVLQQNLSMDVRNAVHGLAVWPYG